MAGAGFGQGLECHYVAGAAFGEVRGTCMTFNVSFFVAGAMFGEIWNDSRSAKIFQYKMLALGVLVCEAGCG